MYIIRQLLCTPFSRLGIIAIGFMLTVTVSYVSYRRALTGAKVTGYLIGFIICIILSIVTTSKLQMMYQVRGPGGPASRVTYNVRQKWDEYSWNKTYRSMRHTYWVSWTDGDIRQPGHHRINLTYERWKGLKIGDPIEITYVPGSSEPYVRDDIFDSDDNFTFDYALLLVELCGVVGFMLKVLTTSNKTVREQDSDIIRLFE